MSEIEINSLSDLESFSKTFLTKISSEDSQKESATVVAFSGDLGAGKTTFIQYLAKDLGVKEVVVSPTFAIMKKYQTKHEVFENLVHLDVYRIDDVLEMKPLLFDEVLSNKSNLVCIEWAEKIKEILPKDTIYIDFRVLSENKRKITF